MRRSHGGNLEQDELLDDPTQKDRMDSFRNRKGTAESILLGCAACLFAAGMILIVLFASQVEVRCMLHAIDPLQSECNIKRMNVWIGPNTFWFHKSQTLLASEITKVSLRPIGLKEWKDEHETAEEMDHLQCHTIIETNTLGDIVLTMNAVPCFDTVVMDELNEFLQGCENWIPSSGEAPSFLFSQRTTPLPQYFGFILIILSFALFVAYYYNAPSLYLQYLHK